MKKAGRYATVAVLLAVAGISGGELCKISAQYIHEAQVKSKLAQFRPQPGEAAGDGGQASEWQSGGFEGEKPLVENRHIINLQNGVNQDISGWLTIPETKIDYPFVKPADNSYYLKRDLYGEYSAAGSIFMDYRCSGAGLEGFNTVLYGHNMKNNSMFGDLNLFAGSGFFESAPNGTLYLKDGTYKLEFFAYMIVGAYDGTVYDIPGDKDGFLEYVRKKAVNFKEPGELDKIATLSTCSYEFSDARIVLIARAISEGEVSI